MADPIRLLIVDDHSIVRDGMRLILETVEDFEVLGEAADGDQAVNLAEELKPDVILMDLRMPGMDGLTAIRQLKETQPQIAVIILTTYNEDQMMLDGLKAGARGYLLKDTPRDLLFDTVRAAARGETLLSPEIMARVLSQAEKDSGAENTAGGIALTGREREVLAAAAEGQISKEIALNLGITERTVKAHLTSIYNKFGVDSRAAAIAEAAKRGWL
jgi:NarL family two-component system response regulator YdfI